MENVSIEQIAKKLNVSPSMVSRVLRHCGGVESDARQRILQEAETILPKRACPVPVYSVFPDRPHYFWHPLRRAFSDALNALEIANQSNVYTKVSDEEAVLSYLEEADRIEVKAIVLAVSLTDRVRERIDHMKDGRLILFLSELSDVSNTFYVGSDALKDGYEAGILYASHYGDRKLICLDFPDNRNAGLRLDGFLKAVSERKTCGGEAPVVCKIDRKALSNFKLIPSKLAPLLREAAGESDPVAVYIPGGIHHAPLAIKKAGLTGRAVLFMHDRNPEEDDPVETVYVNQNVSLQGKTAANLTADFLKTGFLPDRKYTYVSSDRSPFHAE